ncbi:MAG: NAD(P)-binding protein [bacterium]
MDSETYDVAVIGSGFGGMGAALELARSGARVVMYEALTYPGGCASTYSRRGHRFESGATLFSGFGPGQLFDRWTRELELDITFEALDPMVELRTPSFSLEVSSDRDTFLDRFCALPCAKDFPVREFFAKQKAVADTLWGLFDDPAMLPPFGVKEVLGHIAKSPSYASLLPLVNTSLDSVLRRWGVAEFDALRTYLNAVCQITIQTNVAEAEAPFAFATMDYFFRGTGHVHGGVGHLAWALCHAFRTAGRHAEHGRQGRRAQTRGRRVDRGFAPKEGPSPTRRREHVTPRPFTHCECLQPTPGQRGQTCGGRLGCSHAVPVGPYRRGCARPASS